MKNAAVCTGRRGPLLSAVALTALFLSLFPCLSYVHKYIHNLVRHIIAALALILLNSFSTTHTYTRSQLHAFRSRPVYEYNNVGAHVCHASCFVVLVLCLQAVEIGVCFALESQARRRAFRHHTLDYLHDYSRWPDQPHVGANEQYAAISEAVPKMPPLRRKAFQCAR